MLNRDLGPRGRVPGRADLLVPGPVLKSLPLIDFTEANRVHLMYPVLNSPPRNGPRKEQRPFLSSSYRPLLTALLQMRQICRHITSPV